MIPASCEVVGDVYFSGELDVSGKIRGNLVAQEGADAKLILRQTGLVEGNIRAPQMVVGGQVVGDIHVLQHVELVTGAQIRGDVYYNLIKMATGARVDGSLVHVPADSVAPTQLLTRTPATDEEAGIEPVAEAGDDAVVGSDDG